ncbi:3-hydroxy-9,10-secoandrosta-1,3,5(10)-triene-9,17-dione monooxygenase reductase subunit [Streptomyces fractus]|uniref:3-hydroxy-9,10-secoandrosta-1,3,5(10)-triene-9, 17-dione monooxygenase reductase subunit n=1 Tax=Streptomyces fractus TaxID=641806 RepID=UPI003CEC675C
MSRLTAEPEDREDTAIDGRRFRDVMGHFCTGVVIVAASGEDGPAGFACQSFSALSLDPPLVLFCPARTSRTWPVIERAGRFTVNVLAESQRPVSEVFGRSGPDKFTGTDWARTPHGTPLLNRAAAWAECSVRQVHAAGDHYIVVGRVTDLGTHGDQRPLLFHRGTYTGVTPGHVPGPARLPETLADPFLTGDWF